MIINQIQGRMWHTAGRLGHDKFDGLERCDLFGGMFRVQISRIFGMDSLEIIRKIHFILSGEGIFYVN